MSCHDMPRMASRSFPELSEAAFMITLLLPGVASIYYGEEIRMVDVFIRPDQAADPIENTVVSWFTRDSVRTPMQWDSSINAGFTKKKLSWLPVNPDYWANNVQKQLEEPKSHLKNVKRLMQLRKSPVIKDGQFESCVLTPWLFMFKRSLNNETPIVAIINLGTEQEPIRMNSSCALSVPDSLEVHTASLNSGFNIGDKFNICNGGSLSGCLELRPKAGVVLKQAVVSSSGSHAAVISQSLLVLLFSLIIVLF